MASGNWALLDAIYTKRLKLKQVYPHHVANTLAELEAKLSAKNLADHLDGWIAWVRAERRETSRRPMCIGSRSRRSSIRSVPCRRTRSRSSTRQRRSRRVDLTKERVMTWLTSRTKTSSGTKRKYLYALKSFVRYLIDAGVLSSDPLAGLKAPKKNRARERWETVDVDERIVVNALERYRAMFAFVKGTGCDVGAMQRAQIGDVNLFASRATIRGTKTDRRHVFAATIEPWAMPYIKAHLATRRHLGNHALLFETTSPESAVEPSRAAYEEARASRTTP
jgi:site-specific recombinase XerC